MGTLRGEDFVEEAERELERLASEGRAFADTIEGELTDEERKEIEEMLGEAGCRYGSE